MQEVKPSFSCSLDESSFVKDFKWRKKSGNSYVFLSNSGKLYHGVVDGPFKHVMDDVDAGMSFPISILTNVYNVATTFIITFYLL